MAPQKTFLSIDEKVRSLHSSPSTATPSSYPAEQLMQDIGSSKLAISYTLNLRDFCLATRMIFNSGTSTPHVSLPLALTFEVGD